MQPWESDGCGHLSLISVAQSSLDWVDLEREALLTVSNEAFSFVETCHRAIAILVPLGLE